MAKVKVDKKDWTIELAEWNSTTIRSYINHLNEKKVGVPAITNNVRTENAVIAKMIKDYGIETIKAFVEECVNTHKPTEQYPTVNFMFMSGFMKANILPRVMKQKVQTSKLDEIRKRQEQILQTENLF